MKRRLRNSLIVVGLSVFILSVACRKGEKILSAREYFDQGARYFTEQNFTQAGLEFQKVLDLHPESEWADNAQFTLGLIYEKAGDYQKAVEELKKVIENYPKGDKAPNALFGMGEIYEKKLGNNSQAMDAYSQLVSKYPGSRLTPVAREGIERLNKEGEK